jgi:DNA-binding transcriptional regulator YiaG
MNGKSFEMLRKKHEIGRSQFARWAKVQANTVYKWERSSDRHPPDYGVRLLLSYIEIFKAGNSPASSNNSQSQGAQS